MVVGRCWQAVTSAAPGFRPLPERRVLLIGARSQDEAEETALQRSEVIWLMPAQARDPGVVAAALLPGEHSVKREPPVPSGAPLDFVASEEHDGIDGRLLAI